MASEAVRYLVDRAEGRRLGIVHPMAHRGYGLQVSENSPQIFVRHVAKCGPRHDLVELACSDVPGAKSVDELILVVIGNARGSLGDIGAGNAAPWALEQAA